MDTFVKQIVVKDGTVKSITVSAIASGDMPVFGASGLGHAPGAVPDPGAVAGTSRYLGENATFSVPPLTIGVTPVTGGTVGYVLVVDAGNNVGQSQLYGSGAPGVGTLGPIYFDVSNPNDIKFYWKT